MSTGEQLPDFEHEHYGRLRDQPYAAIDGVATEMWIDVFQEVLMYKLGPPVAWERDGSRLYLWGDQLDEDTLRRITTACHEREQELADLGDYDGAKLADRAESKVSRTEVVAA